MAQQTLKTLIIELRADVAQLKSGLTAANKEVENSTSHWKEKLLEVAGAFGLAFGAHELISFMKESLVEYAKQQQALGVLADSISRTGQSWGSMREAAERYIETARATTRFQEEEVINSLTNLTQRTKDYTQAQALNDVAMNMAVARHMSLEQASNILGLAVIGNQRGLLQLAKALGVTGEGAKDAGALIAKAAKDFDGLAESEEGAARTIDRFNKNVERSKEAMGEYLEYYYEWLTSTNAFAPTNAITQSLDVQKRLYRKHWDDLLDYQKKALGEKYGAAFLVQMEKEHALFLKEENEKATALKKAEESANKTAKAEKDKESRKKKEEADNKKFREDQERGAKHEKDTAVQMEQQAKAVGEAEKKVHEDVEKSAKHKAEVVSGVSQEAAGKMVAAYKEGTLTIGLAFEILGKAIFKAIVKSLGQALIEEGAKYYAQALAFTLSLYGAPAAPGAYAAGTALSAAGGAMIGVAEAALAEGGIVTSPTVALIGEAGPEKVIPLDKDEGQKNWSLHQHFAAGTSRADAHAIGQSSARALFSELQRMKTRSGNRNSRF